MDGHIHLVVALIDDAYDLTISVADRHSHQSCKLTNAEIHMHYEVARLHLLQFLHSQCHLASAGRLRAEVVFMVTSEYLVVSKEAHRHILIHEACVKYGTQDDGSVDYVKGANIAGFMKVATAMLEQGTI